MQLITLWLLAAGAGSAADWSWQDAPVETGFELHTGSLPGDATAWEGALDEALRVWNVEGDASVVLAYAGRTTTPGDGGGGDAHNTIDAGTGAGTAVVVVSDAASGDDLEECDLRMLTSNGDGAVTWSTAADGAGGGEFDAARALIYGLGRCLGLPETSAAPSALSPPEPGTGPDERRLYPADVTALQALYGEPVAGLAEYTHAVVYDLDDPEAGDGRGAPGELVLLYVRLINDGDPVWEPTGTVSTVTSTATFTWVDDTEAIEDIDREGLGEFSFTFEIDTCNPNSNPTTVSLAVEDARGDVQPIELSFPIQCAEPRDDEPPPDEGGCGCGTGGPAGGWLLVLACAVLGGRRRR